MGTLNQGGTTKVLPESALRVEYAPSLMTTVKRNNIAKMGSHLGGNNPMLTPEKPGKWHVKIK